MKDHDDMNKKLVYWVKPASFLAVAALGSAPIAGCAQERVGCQTSHGDFAVKLTLKTGTGACSESVGGVYGVNTYFGVGDGRPDYKKSSLAIQAEELGLLVEDAEARLGEMPDAENPTFALGAFAAAMPKDGLCTIPTFAPAVKNLPALEAIPDDPETPDEDESIPAEPAKAFKYEWSNMVFLVTESATGTQFIGDLKFTQDGCTAEYEAWGLYPAVFCGDDDGNPVDAFCNAVADPDNGIPVGSGINPDFPVHCDPDLLLCMLTEKPPTQ